MDERVEMNDAQAEGDGEEGPDESFGSGDGRGEGGNDGRKK